MDCIAIYLMAFSFFCVIVYIAAYICSKIVKKHKEVIETFAFICGYSAIAGGFGSILVSAAAVFINHFF